MYINVTCFIFVRIYNKVLNIIYYLNKQFKMTELILFIAMAVIIISMFIISTIITNRDTNKVIKGFDELIQDMDEHIKKMRKDEDNQTEK